MAELEKDELVAPEETPVTESVAEEVAVPVSESSPEVAEGTPEEAIAPEPSMRDKFHSRIKSSYPDDKFDDDDSVYGKAMERYDEMEGFMNKGKEVNKKLLEALKAEPELDGIVRSVLKGMPIRSAIAKYFSPEDLTPQEGEEDFEAYSNSANERAKKIADQEKFEKEVEANLAESESVLNSFAEENGLDDNGKAELVDVITELMGDLYRGRLPKNLLSHVQRSKGRDAEVSKALEDGKIEGKNEKIEAIKKNEKKTGDGIPTFNGGATEEIKEEAVPEKKSRFDRLVEREKSKNKF